MAKKVRRKFLKKSLTRPKKGGAGKRRRQADQRKRLVELGMDATAVAKLNAREVLTELKYPAKIGKA